MSQSTTGPLPQLPCLRSCDWGLTSSTDEIQDIQTRWLIIFTDSPEPSPSTSMANLNSSSPVAKRRSSGTASFRTQPDKGPWRLSLLGYIYDIFMELCPRRDYRFKVWDSYHTVGTHITTDVRLHTFEIPEDIRESRWDIAQSLGYDNYAQMSMETKMARNVKTVLQMLDTYRNHFLPEAKQEMKELQCRGLNAKLVYLLLFLYTHRIVSR